MVVLSPEERAIVLRGIELLVSVDLSSQNEAPRPAAASPMGKEIKQ
jgi:hypothetical protein